MILNYGSDNELTILDGKDKEITFDGKKSTVKIFADAGVFDGKRKSITLAADIKDSFSAATYKKLVTIDGAATDNIEITGNSKANIIIAGNNGSTLTGGKGKDTLVGGDGADIFIYNVKSGNKVIRNCGNGDLVSLGSGAEISQVTAKNKNVVLKVGSNTITIEDTDKFTFMQGGASEAITYNNKMLIVDKSVTLASDYKEKVFDLNAEGNDAYNHVSATLGKKAVNLIGNAEGNSLIGGKGKDSLNGGAGNDTLWGGKGNDVLWGGDGADTFVFRAGEGNDVINNYNFEDGDLLRILDKRGREISNNAIKKATFKGEDLTLSIKGGGKLILAGVGTSATINVNGTEQTF